MSFVLSVWQNSDDIFLTLIALVAFVLAIYFAIVPHEIAHGLVAKWNGDLTAKVNGRLSMNPVVHFDLIGFLMLLTMGFGFAKPVPVNPYNFKVPRRGLFTVSIAGVTYNFAAIIVSCFFLALILFLEPMLFSVYYLYVFLYWFFFISASVNTMLFLFNIIPLGPLDGFKMIEAYANRGNKFIAFLRAYGTYILIGLFVLHMFVYYVGGSVDAGWLQYVDILGLYLNWGSFGIAGGIMSLFGMMFGMGPIGFVMF